MDKRDSNLLLVLLSSAVLLISTFIFTSAVQKEPKIRFGKASENVVTKELVSGFPLIPEYPASHLDNSYKQEDGSKIRYVAYWLTSDSVPQVEMWYKEELVDSGWVIDNLPADENDEQIQYLVAIKDRWLSNSKLLLFGLISIIFYLFFASSSVNAQAFRFVSWGDTKIGTSTLSGESNQAKALNPKFTIYAGDLVSSWSIPAIEAWVVAVNGGNNNGMRDITFPVRGNHDSGASQRS